VALGCEEAATHGIKPATVPTTAPRRAALEKVKLAHPPTPPSPPDPPDAVKAVGKPVARPPVARAPVAKPGVKIAPRRNETGAVAVERSPATAEPDWHPSSDHMLYSAAVWRRRSA